MKVTDKITVTNEDNMQLMARYPDGYFNLALIDPPYGIGEDGKKNHSRGKPVTIGNSKSKAVSKSKKYTPKAWDKKPMSPEYFKELFRVSKNQIIWGANYFTEYLPSSMGWIYWDKGQKLTMSDGELAYSSFQRALRSFVMNRVAIQEFGGLLHPTQKPVRLYTWLLTNYAKAGDKILDTHVGSASSLIACHQLGFDVVGCELDEEYYQLASQRLADEMAQMSLFNQ